MAQADRDAVELSPHYYRDNFLRLFDTVQRRYGDILTAREQAVLDCFQEQSFDAQCLYIRLVSRTGPWFRESRLHYPEIGAVTNALDALLGAGLVEEAAALDSAALGQLFTRAELERAFSAQLAGRRVTSKARLLQEIADLQCTATELARHASSLEPARIVAPAHGDVIALLQLLFFGNRRQGLTEFVLEDLGITAYYPYPLQREQRLFGSRQALEEYLACAELADTYYQHLEQGTPADLAALAREVAALEVRHASSDSRYHRLCNRLARDLERQGEFELAAALYARSERHPARERHTRILEKRGQWRAAREQCEAILAQPWCEAEQEAARRILPRVQRKLGEQPAPRSRDRFDEMRLRLPAGPQPVELLAAQSLQGEWRQVHYVENRLMNSLFGLAFWEEIFMPVPGVFHHAYQGGPTDLYEREFRQRRAAAIGRRLQRLHGADAAALLTAAYDRYHPCLCHWVDWRYISRDLVAAAARSIPMPHLLAVFERLLFDPRENRRGFPDLLALGDAPGQYCLIEVKSPGDTLQDNQKRWLRYFADQGIPARVARVDWADD